MNHRDILQARLTEAQRKVADYEKALQDLSTPGNLEKELAKLCPTREIVEAILKCVRENPPRCATCKYYNGDNVCSGPAFVYGSGESKPDQCKYYDYDGYRASVEPGPDFGCVHWRPYDD